MKKLIFVLIFFVIVILLFRGCDNKEEKVVFEKIESTLPELKEYFFDRGSVLDEEDVRTISFEPIQVRPGLMLERAISINKTEGLEWNLSFESSDFVGEYTHIESIPKSFAEDVDQIKFSLEPDVIIDADPSVAWIMNVTAGFKFNIVMNVGLDKMIGKDFDLISVAENFDDIRIFVGLERCRLAKSDYGRLLCMIDLIGKYPDKFTLEHCKGLADFSQGDQEGSISEMQACRAFLSNDINECENYEVYGEDEYYSDHCRKHAFLTAYASCLNENEEIHKDYCIKEKAVWSGYAEGCSKISNILPYQYCIAEVNQDDDACAKLLNYGDMFSESDRIGCCKLLKDDAYQSRCIEYVSDEKKIEVSNNPCTESDDEDYLNYCYKIEAKKTCDVNYCLLIEKQRDQDECVLEMNCGLDNCLVIDGNYRLMCIWQQAKTPEECALFEGEEYDGKIFGNNQVYNQETCNTREKMNTNDLEKWRERLRNP